MHARSALFDLYGDHLRTRGNQAPVAAIVRLLAPVGIAAPAVRTAISRMVTQGWLEPITVDSGRGYRATSLARRRLDEAADRIYRRHEPDWDGGWHLAVVSPSSDRSARARLRADLTYLGYAGLADNVWISPFERTELPSVLQRNDAQARTGRLLDPDPDPVDAWDLAALQAAYDEWLATADRLVAQHTTPHAEPDEAAFAGRFHLVHEWRKFLFADPGLPPELLPDDWPGHEAARRFASEAARLLPGADRFIDQCLA
jgi:phenylacetic acid degradation operon negative regulatory protein